MAVWPQNTLMLAKNNQGLEAFVLDFMWGGGCLEQSPWTASHLRIDEERLLKEDLRCITPRQPRRETLRGK